MTTDRTQPSSAHERDLMLTAAGLVSLARGIVGDVAAAEDVVQSAVAEGLARGEAGTSAVWLPRLVRFRALDAVRAKRRARETLETLTPPDRPSLDPAHIAETMETRRRLMEAVEELHEPYRSALFLRYFEDLTPTEIARRGHEPTKTVKTRLRRGLVLLRERFERRGELPALALLARRPIAAKVASSSIPIVSAMSNSTKIIALFSAALLPFAVWLGVWINTSREKAPTPVVDRNLLQQNRESQRSALKPVSREEATRVAAVESRAPESNPLADTPSPAASEVQEPSPRAAESEATRPEDTVVHVHVLWPDNTPAPDVAVVLRSKFPRGDRRAFQPNERRAVTGADGTATFLGPLASGSTERVRLKAERGSGETRLEASAPIGRTTTLELVLEEGLAVHGQVVDADGHPKPRASIWLTMPWTGLNRGRIVTETDAAGRFELRDVPYGSSLGAIAGRAMTRELIDLDLVEVIWNRADVRLVLDLEGCGVDGRVVNEFGDPLADASVVLMPQFGSEEWEEREAADGSTSAIERWSAVATRTASNGSFEFASFHTDVVEFRVDVPGRSTWSGTRQLEFGAINDVTLVVKTPARVRGRVTDANGAPVTGAIVLPLGFPVTAEIAHSVSQLGPEGPFGSVISAEDGTYELPEVTTGPTWLLACRPKGAPTPGWASFEVELDAGSELVWSPSLNE